MKYKSAKSQCKNCMIVLTKSVHPVSITRLKSFRTQPLENLSVDSIKSGFLSNPRVATSFGNNE